MHRREFLAGVAAVGVAGHTLLSPYPTAAQTTGQPTALPIEKIPRWRGFNLQWERHQGDAMAHPFAEEDFATMQDWGFNFARLPLSYWIWGKPTDWTYINEEPLKELDRAIDLGKQHSIHINLNFHRIPGYCINQRELEPADLFTGRVDERRRALEAAVYHWRYFAKRFKGVPTTQLSFDLINEPPKMRSYEGEFQERYVEVVKALVAAIREESPRRLIFADGINIGQNPVIELAPMNIVQSTRGYQPKAVSHYGANWVPKDEYETTKVPTWPLTDDKGTRWDRARLQVEYVDKYKELTDLGVQIHVGEWGCYNQTPHDVALAWMSDCTSVWKQAGWGNALWNLRGTFGVLDSERKDVAYEDYKGHKLDRKMLEVLKKA
ncbi:glycoside hydrolase family 5 protein [Silvibacterium acidisoli]|uniref:glycoside hydrolase family 5 protein n=1 Tax=Acidobacteriaceae bacterium ZG23-2 TaxID=2883246 RepID=UPI00406C122A